MLGVGGDVGYGGCEPIIEGIVQCTKRCTILRLELMFMKHYAPNRCLNIKVAKLRTGMGSAEMSHLQNCSLKIYLKRALGGRVWGVRMDVNEELKFVFFLGGGGVGSGGGGGRVGGSG